MITKYINKLKISYKVDKDKNEIIIFDKNVVDKK